MKTYNEFIRDYLEELDDIKLLEEWNEYCIEENPDACIYENDEYFFDEYFQSADDAVRAVCYGDYRYTDTYVIFNGYANLESFSGYDLKDYIYIDELADYFENKGFLKDEYSDYVEENQEV